MAGFTNLGEVYDFVSVRAGDCCAVEGAVESAIIQALIGIRDALGVAEFEVSGSFTTQNGYSSFSLPAGVYYPKRLFINNCELDRGVAACMCHGTEHTGQPDRWEWGGNATLTLHPTADAVYTVTVKGLSAQGVTLKSGDTWLTVASVLPNSNMGLMLARWALAVALVDSDQNRASTYMSMAQTDLANWQERKLGNPNARFVMSGGPFRCADQYDSFDERFVIR